MLNACADCRALTSGDCGKHNIGVRDVMEAYVRSAMMPVSRIRAAIALLWPDEMTPNAKRVLEGICAQYDGQEAP
jgi:hypothetical protein